LQEVEAFSKKELDRIAREHAVDDDWLYRTGMQAVVAGQQKAGWYIPSSVSQRRMLRSAYRTHIYSFGTDPSQECTGVLDLAMHSDGNRMLSKGRGDKGLRLWDVQAKCCIRSFVGEIGVDTVCFSAGCATSQMWDDDNQTSLQIWDLNSGTCRYSIEVELGFGKHIASNDEVFVPNVGDEDGAIDAINIHTGGIRSSSRQTWCTENVPVELHLCGDFLLVAVPIYTSIYHGDEECERDSVRKAGIYIFDRSSLELMNHVARSYICMRSAANGDVVAETIDGRFDVHQLLDGYHLVFRTSFHRRFPQNGHQTDYSDNHSILLVHNSRAYVRSCREDPASCTEVYNILAGDLERTLWHPPRRRDGTLSPRCLVAGKKELFCGFESHGSATNATSAIKVYLLE
jgi:hypothetical protein